MTAVAAKADTNHRDSVPTPPRRGDFRKHRAYTTAVKRRHDMVEERIAQYEAQRWDAEMQVAALSAQVTALLGLADTDLAVDDAMVAAVRAELDKQRQMVVSFDAALEALRGLEVPGVTGSAAPAAAETEDKGDG